MYLDSLHVKFSIIGLTETWLDDDKVDFYDIREYDCTNNLCRKGKRGGGIMLAVKYGIPYTVRDDLQFFYSEMESVFIEIDKQVFSTVSNIVIAVIYRVPDSSIEVFNNRMQDIFNALQREKKSCYLLGDMNIDFLKHDIHKLTSEFIDLIYSYNAFPLITKPTRVTTETATLIDHIITNNFHSTTQHYQGILCSSISDHYAIFHITDNTKVTSSALPTSFYRDHSTKNIEKFKEELQNLEWQEIKSERNAQKAYSIFHTILSEKYNKCFPLKKVKKKYYCNKPWLTPVLKQAIKRKNKLYTIANKRHNTGNSKENLEYYKKYRNRLHHILNSAERKYFQDKLLEHKSNIKKSWQIIKLVINKRKHKQNCTHQHWSRIGQKNTK